MFEVESKTRLCDSKVSDVSRLNLKYRSIVRPTSFLSSNSQVPFSRQTVYSISQKLYPSKTSPKTYAQEVQIPKLLNQNPKKSAPGKTIRWQRTCPRRAGWLAGAPPSFICKLEMES